MVSVKQASPGAQALTALVKEFLMRAGYQLAQSGEGSHVTVVVDDEGWYLQDEAGRRLSGCGLVDRVPRTR